MWICSSTYQMDFHLQHNYVLAQQQLFCSAYSIIYRLLKICLKIFFKSPNHIFSVHLTFSKYLGAL